jgi:hypothetical protein
LSSGSVSHPWLTRRRGHPWPLWTTPAPCGALRLRVSIFRLLQQKTGAWSYK